MTGDGLVVPPRTGPRLNLEEPLLLSLHLAEFRAIRAPIRRR